ncbi:hypothetical protein INT47_005302 [Mucor saturninus]|uniref:Uncharacterized protein n=1 Tax=Mucor saturninus TaxID=64648 RepID=A0A8H7R7W3_9FUNG|nr:hypothetical protein INT47_005302 [Mucor saturninus]
MSNTFSTGPETCSGWKKFGSKLLPKIKDTKLKSDTPLKNSNNGSIVTNKDDKISWLNVICYQVSRKLKMFKHDNKTHQQNLPHIIATVNDNGTLSPSKFDDQQEPEILNHDIIEGDTVPLHQLLRYSMDSSDLRKFQLRRMTQPFKPTYEIEWQKNEWLQLDHSTSRNIERLRVRGFSRITIRKDETLKKHIMYDNPSETDILLELSIYGTENKNGTEKGSKPILCHQPSQFPLRRTYWWHASYRVGEAHLPNWADKNSCCDNNNTHANSGLNTICNNKQSHFFTAQQLNGISDTPSVSESSYVSQQFESLPLNPVKPLEYTEPPFLMPKPVLCAT